MGPAEAKAALQRIADSPRPIVAFVAHAWGGGLRRHVADLEALVANACEVVRIEPAARGAVRLRWMRDGESLDLAFAVPQDEALLLATLKAIGLSRLHFHHVHGLPRTVLDWPAALDVPYDCTLHDYYPICPQYHLDAGTGRYCGEPGEDGCNRCLSVHPAQWPLDIAGWRTLFERFLRGASRVIAPSSDVAQRIGRYMPGVAIEVWPHPEAAAAATEPPARVLTLGTLTAGKGLAVVAACARDAQARGLPLAFRVLGATDAALPDLGATLARWGEYAEGDLAALVAAERPDAFLFAAQVPESYSYTLSVAMASGKPIVASALGAFNERLAGHPHAKLLAFDAAPAEWNEALLAVLGRAYREPAVAR